MLRNILITGGTGKQGGAVITALSALQPKPFTLYALTRDVSSNRAQQLASKHGVKLVQGTFDDPTAAFNACGVKITSVFAVQLPAGFPPSAEAEEKHGKDFIDAAVAHGVSVYVQTSVDRGVDGNTNPTNVPHFISKFNIEQHLKAQAKESGMSYTILQPTFFMDNFVAGFPAKMIATIWRDTLPHDVKLQMVHTRDVGWFAAQALTKPDDEIFKNKSISIAGDALNYEEVNAAYREGFGYPLPTTFGAIGWAVTKMVKELSTMFTFFKEKGYNADIPALKEIHPDLTTFKQWVDENKPKSEG